MKHAMLARCLKGIELFLSLIGGFAYFYMVPVIITNFGRKFPEFQHLVTPSIIFISLSAVPVMAALTAVWMICSNIAKENSFCPMNAKYLTVIGICAFADTMLFFALAVYLGIAGAQNPGTFLIFLGLVVAGLAVAAVAFLLSHLIYKAGQMEEEIRQTV